jgi:uncharacterized membrane protein
VRIPGGETPLRLLLVLLVFSGLLARFWGLSTESFWLDELRSLGQSDPDLPQARLLEERIAGDVHPPLYVVLLRAWRAAFGSTESAVRLLSALLSAAAVPLGALLARRPFGDRVALVLAALLACSFGGIRYGQEARAYAGLFLVATIAALLYTRAVRDLARGHALPLPFYAALVTTALVGCGLHYFGALLAFVTLGLLVLRSLWARRERLGMLASALLVAAAFAPWPLRHLPVIGYQTGGHFWLTNDPVFLRGQALELLGLWSGSAWAGAATAVVLVAALPGHRSAARAARPAFEMAGATLLAALLVSLHTPVLTARNLIVLLPPL